MIKYLIYYKIYLYIIKIFYLENFKRQKQFDAEKTNDYRQETFSNLNQMLNNLKKWNVSEEKIEHIVDYVWKLAEIESKYWKMKDDIKKDFNLDLDKSIEVKKMI